MKKQYITPEILIIDVPAIKLMAGSGLKGSSQSNPSMSRYYDDDDFEDE